MHRGRVRSQMAIRNICCLTSSLDTHDAGVERLVLGRSGQVARTRAHQPLRAGGPRPAQQAPSTQRLAASGLPHLLRLNIT